MKVTIFASQTDNIPAATELSWEALVAEIANVRAGECTLASCTRSGGAPLPDGTFTTPCLHKGGYSWSPIAYKDGARRGKFNVEAAYALVVDIDHVPDEQIASRLAPIEPYRHIVHGSHSDRFGDRCVRVILDVSRPVTPDEWPRFWLGSAKLLGADPNTKDISRIFFLPSRPSDAVTDVIDGTGYLFFHADGAALDVDAILATVPASAVPTVEYEQYDIPEFKGAPEMEKLAEAARILARAWPPNGSDRHGAHLALAGALARGGWPVELIAEFAMGVAELQQPGNADYAKRMGAARSSVDKVEAGYAVKGWPTLVEHVGEDVVDQVTVLLGFPQAPKDDPHFVAAMAKRAESAAAEALLRQKQETEAKRDQMVAAMRAPAAPAVIDVVASYERPETQTQADRPTHVPSSLDLDVTLKAAQKKLATRKDPDNLKTAELLKRVNNSQFLTDDVKEDREQALSDAAIAVARAAPPGVTPDMLIRKLMPSAGNLAVHLPEIVNLAMDFATTQPPLLSRPPKVARAVEGDFEFKDGVPVATSQRNFRLALQKLGIQLRYNEFAEHEVLVRSGTESVIEDHHIDGMAFEFEENFNFYPPPDKFNRFVTKVARESKYHPPREYLQECYERHEDAPFTNLPEEWLIRFAGADDSPYIRAISRLVLVAAARRIRTPGVKFDEMLILETLVQGKGKSQALRALAGNDDWFTDEFSLDADSRKMMETTSGKWIVEAGELRGMTGRDHNALKQYLSRCADRSRLAYGRKPKEVRRQFVVIGTTNDEQYLVDPSGNRRYWPVRVVEFDVPGLVSIREKLWAEAVRLDLEHADDPEFIRLHPSLYPAAAAEQDKRKVDDPYEIKIEDVLGGMTGRVRIQDVWKILIEDKTPTKSEQMQIAKVMQSLGWSRERPMIGGDRGYYYERGSDEERKMRIVVSGGQATGGFQVKVLPPPHVYAEKN